MANFRVVEAQNRYGDGVVCECSSGLYVRCGDGGIWRHSGRKAAATFTRNIWKEKQRLWKHSHSEATTDVKSAATFTNLSCDSALCYKRIEMQKSADEINDKCARVNL